MKTRGLLQFYLFTILTIPVKKVATPHHRRRRSSASMAGVQVESSRPPKHINPPSTDKSMDLKNPSPHPLLQRRLAGARK